MFQKHHLANQVHVVRDGAEALEYIFCTDRYADREIGKRPKVILLDLKLPLVDGIEVLRSIRGNPRLQDLCVLMLTAVANTARFDEVNRLKPNGFVEKPFRIHELLTAIKHALEKQKG